MLCFRERSRGCPTTLPSSTQVTSSPPSHPRPATCTRQFHFPRRRPLPRQLRTARSTAPTVTFADDDAALERQPTLADSDWLTYIVAGIVGMALTSALWQNVIPGIIVAMLMVGMLVFADKRYGKGIPRAPS